MRQNRMAYAFALALGCGFVAWLVPFAAWWPADPLDAAFDGDNAQSVIGQRYFLAEPWRWPPFQVRRLAWPAGINVAFTDSIPLLLLPLKLICGLLPPGFYVQAGWIVIVWALQPAAAVFALRSVGERRWLPASAVAVMSLAMPSLLLRFGQMSLCTHALLLVALGLYFRLTHRAGAREGIACLVLLCAALLVHPYLLVMVAALLAAAPLSLRLHGDPRWRRCAAWLLGGMVATASLAIGLGYGGVGLVGGYGIYSMNLLGPFVPGPMGALPAAITDPTGGQAFEGYQYLGAGLLLLWLAAGVAMVRSGAQRLRRHAGLGAMLVALCLFALSGVVYVGGHKVSDLHHLPVIILQFRATGRFFWPVAYAILVCSVAAVASAWPRRYPALLLAAVALQVIDAAKLVRQDYDHAHAVIGWSIDRPALAPIMARHDLLTIWPTDGCGADTVAGGGFMQLLLLGSQTLIRTNTMYAARPGPSQPCDPQTALGQPWRPGELRVILPPARPAERHFVPDAERLCWQATAMVLCAEDAMAGLMHPTEAAPPRLPLGQALAPSSPSLRAALAEGWSAEQPDGIWTLGQDASLRMQPLGPGPTRLTIEAFTLGPTPHAMQSVRVLADDAPVAEWRSQDMAAATLEAVLPAGTTVIRLHVDHPVRPTERGRSSDFRPLGLHLTRLRLDPA